MSLATNKERGIVVASLFEDFPANRTSALYKIECLEFCLSKIFPVASVAPFPDPDVSGLGFAHLKCQHMDVGPLPIFRYHFRQFERRREVHDIVEGDDDVAFRRTDAGISSPARSLILRQFDQLYAGIKARDESCNIFLGVIVDDDDFAVLVRLHQRGLYRLLQSIQAFVVQNDDAYPRRFWQKR